MIYANNYDYNHNSVDTEEFKMNIPRICRHCHQTGEQTFINATVIKKNMIDDPDISETNFVVFTGCSYCGNVTQHFCTEYAEFGEYRYTLGKTIPEKPTTEIKIPGNISTISPDFIDIYKQATIAEKQQLTHLAGMGYRKSIEFLITDYLLAYTPKGVTIEWIKDPNTSLSKKISKLKNERLKQLSRAISFIGNDETHYVKRNPDYDIQDLKEFIKVLMSDFENELIFEKAEKLLNKSSS